MNLKQNVQYSSLEICSTKNLETKNVKLVNIYNGDFDRRPSLTAALKYHDHVKDKCGPFLGNGLNDDTKGMSWSIFQNGHDYSYKEDWREKDMVGIRV